MDCLFELQLLLVGLSTKCGAREIRLRVGINEEVTFTGGVARNLAMIATLEERLGTKVNVSEESHFMGALGAALFALDHVLAGRVPVAQTARAL